MSVTEKTATGGSGDGRESGNWGSSTRLNLRRLSLSAQVVSGLWLWSFWPLAGGLEADQVLFDL